MMQIVGRVNESDISQIARRGPGVSVRKVAMVLSLAAGAYALVARPRLLRWGATDEEVRRPYPGA